VLARYQQLFASGIFLLDGVLLFAAWLGAYALRFHLLGLAAPLGIPPLSLYLWFGAVLTPVALLILRSYQIYRSSRTAPLSHELFSLVQGIVVVTAIAAVASYFMRGELSRSALALFAVLAIVLLCGNRVLIRTLLRSLRRRGLNMRYAVVVGTGDLARALLTKLAKHPDYGISVRGIVAIESAATTPPLGKVPVLGAIADLPGLVERAGADLVYLALGREAFRAEQDALERLSDSTATVRLVPDLASAFTINASIEDLDGMPIVRIAETPDQGWNGVIKRAFDLAFSALGLIVLSPVLLALAIAVRRDSPGPVLYRQERVGMNGRKFRMLKFRTMRPDAESAGPGWTTPDDPRRTRLGATLRKLSLDELPQLWNVLRGDMSLVGPRPERPMYVEQFRGSIPRYMLRHHVKAGITGWAQVHGLRGDTPLDRRIEYDLYYIRNWSLFFDVRILFLTAMRVFRDASAH
jgi:Undecaprenyl-phosphate glucose phosphotransferase